MLPINLNLKNKIVIMNNVLPFNIIICGCTINSESSIVNSINKLSQLKKYFNSVDILIYENDSHDNTPQILKKMRDDQKIKLISETGIKNKLLSRTMIIAHGRNQLVNTVVKLDKYDYMVMLDYDLLSDFDVNTILTAFQYDNESWDVLTGNCLKKYYDIWALRINKNAYSTLHKKIWNNRYIDYDCWDMIAHNRQMGYYNIPLLKRLHIKAFQTNIPKTYPLIPVESAFNGIGIYKVSKIKNCKYVGFRQQCSCKKYNIIGKCAFEKCEHVSFHKDIITKNNGRIFICPSLLVPDQKEHWVK